MTSIADVALVCGNRLRRRKVLRLHLRRRGMSGMAFRLMLMKELLRIPNWIFFLLRPIDIQEKLLHLADWAQHARITEPFEPTISIAGQDWRIPAPMAADMPIQQYLLCERYFEAILTGKTSSPSEFLACLLRPDTRELQHHLHDTGLLPVVSHYQLKEYRKPLDEAFEEDVFYLIQYYATQRELLKDKYPNIHEPNADGAPAAPTDWDSIAPRIAELGIFGTLEQVLRTPTTSYLAWANAKTQPEKPQSLQDIIRSNHQKHLN